MRVLQLYAHFIQVISSVGTLFALDCDSLLNMLNMSRPFQALIFLLAASAAAATNATSGHERGCELMVPQSVRKHMKPLQKPLIINVEFVILGVTDVPTSGGAITVEFMFVPHVFLY